MTAPYAALDALQNSQAIEIYWLNLCVDHGSSALGVAMVCSPSVLQSAFPILTKAYQLKAGPRPPSVCKLLALGF